MTDAELAELTNAYVAGVLIPADRDRLAQHLRSHPDVLPVFEAQVQIHVALMAMLAPDDPGHLARRAELVLADAADSGERLLAQMPFQPAADPSYPRRGQRRRFAAVAGLAAMLLLGMIVLMRLPIQPMPPVPPAESAWIESLSGEVSISSVEGQLAAAVGQALLPGQQIRTLDDDSAVVLRLPHGVILELGGATAVAMLDGLGVILEEGMLSADVPPRPASHPLTVRIPCGEVRAPSGRFVSVASAAASRVEPEVGQLQIATRHGQVTDVPAGSYATVSADSDAFRVVPAAIRVTKPRLTLAVGGGPVRSVAFAPDGSTLALGGWDGKVTVWNPLTGTRVHTFNAFTRRVAAVAYSSDGGLLAAATDDLPNRVPTVGVWSVNSFDQRLSLTGLENVKSLAFAPDGRTLASGGYNGKHRPGIFLWDVPSGRPQPPLPGALGEAPAIAFSPNGRVMATGHGDGAVCLRDASNPAAMRTIGRHSGWVSGLAFSPDGNTLVTGGRDNTVRLWNLPAGEERLRLAGLGGRVQSVAFSPDGRSVAAAGGRLATVWDVDTGAELATFVADVHSVGGVAFDKSGKTLVTTSWKGMAKLWTIPARDRPAD